MQLSIITLLYQKPPVNYGRKSDAIKLDTTQLFGIILLF